MVSSKIQLIIVLSAVLLMLGNSQNPNQFTHVESAKYSAVAGQQFGITVSEEGQNITLVFQNPFTVKPEVGLSVYNMKFEYNPEFSVRLLEQTTTSFTFRIQGSSSIFNELFVMYIASDEETLGIFMPEQQNTNQLDFPGTLESQYNRSQSFDFNFKNNENPNGQKIPIFPSTTDQRNIRVSVYLTGIQASSETIQNGYPKNYNYFGLEVSVLNTTFYRVTASIKSSFGDVLISEIEFTIVYFNVANLIEGRYQIDSSILTMKNFGGTFFKSAETGSLNPLPINEKFANQLKYFFGISLIECDEGESINLLAVERFDINEDGKVQNLLLTMETERNTFILEGVYSYIQYKTLRCGQPGSFCTNIDCTDASIPKYQVSEDLCYPCYYTCASCQTDNVCTGCPPTRTLDKGNCICQNNTLYNEFGTLQCLNCFQDNNCKACERKGICLTCYLQDNFVRNPVLQTCQCKAPYYLGIKAIKNYSEVETACIKCMEGCVYCKNETYCEGSSFGYFLNDVLDSDGKKTGVNRCSPVCSQTQIYDAVTDTCSKFTGDTELFDQEGRFNFDWDYQNSGNELVIDLVFSQRQTEYYYYEDGFGYEVTGSESQTTDQSGQGSFFYDDGKTHYDGYSNVQTYSTTTFYEGSSFTQTTVSQSVNQNIFDESSLQGEYYGLGQAQFFSKTYQTQYITQNITEERQYVNEFGIPIGKHLLSNMTEDVKNNNAIEALQRNLVLKIDEEVVPYTISAKSNNQFELIARPEKSYLATDATLQIKNPGLIRAQNTSIQTTTVSKQLDRFDLYTQNQFSTAESLRDRNVTVVQVLWGICKYLLFIGFGWPVMPLMLIMQYIMGHNYINTQLPLNLDYFLASFADFRNPSILFNPERNDFDASVVNHPPIYKEVGAYEEFDRGIDFMKNSFQFFFTPLLSFALLFLLIGINCLVGFCGKTVPLIGGYLQPRAGLHAGAYTLVQSLPVSFFFFGQLNDTRYNHPNSPNGIYPSFNTAMAYAAFFASIIIPLLILVKIYEKYNVDQKVSPFVLNVFKNKNIVSDAEFQQYKDPLWGGNTSKPASYGFGGAVFFLPLIAGFFLGFFTGSYPWQLTGLLVFNILFLSFAAASGHFDHKVFKYYFVGVTGLMVVYELVHAGIGSNRALNTTDQWNSGYLGIGLIYAMLLTALIFSGYLLYKTFWGLFKGHKDNNFKFVTDIDSDRNKLGAVADKQQEAGQQLKSKRMKSKLFGESKLRSNADDNMNSQERMLSGKDKEQQDFFKFGGNKEAQFQFQELLFSGNDRNGNFLYYGEKSKNQYLFPPKAGAWLNNKYDKLYLDSKDNIYDGNKMLIQSYEDLRKGESEDEEKILKNNLGSYKTIVIKGSTYNIEEKDDIFILTNPKTGNVQRMSQSEFGNFMNAGNSNMGEIIMYENQEYENEGRNDEGYFLLRNSQKREKVLAVTEEQLRLLKENEKRKTLSIIGSQRSIKSSEGDNMQLIKAPNKTVVKKKNIYNLNGTQYQEVGEQNGKVHLFNKERGESLYFTRQQLQKMTITQINSQRTIEENKTFIINNEPNRYLGTDGNSHIFYNEAKRSETKISNEDFMVLLERQNPLKQSKNSQTLFVESRVGQNFQRKIVPKYFLKFTGQGQDNTYLYEEEDGDGIFSIPQDQVNKNSPVYFDHEGNICQNNVIIVNKEDLIEEEEEEFVKGAQIQMVKRISQQKIVSYGSISSVNVDEIYSKNKLYHLTFISPSYSFAEKGEKGWSETDVLKRVENVRGDRVQKLINQHSEKFPKLNACLVDARDPSSVFTIQQS